MTDTLLRPIEPSALRRYGTWGEEGYRFDQGPQGAVGVKRFTWRCPAIAAATQEALPLTYFADATVDAKRMNDLAHLAERERAAVEVLEAMVLAATNGVAYLGLPHSASEITRDVVALVGQWVADRGHPDRWERALAQVIHDAVERLNAYQRHLITLGGATDPEHTEWGVAVRIRPIEPTEPTA